jgi:hypothetical protein
VKASNSYARILIFDFFILLYFIKFFSLPLFQFFDLAFYYLFSFFYLVFLSPFIFLVFFVLVLYSSFSHVILSLAYSEFYHPLFSRLFCSCFVLSFSHVILSLAYSEIKNLIVVVIKSFGMPWILQFQPRRYKCFQCCSPYTGRTTASQHRFHNCTYSECG